MAYERFDGELVVVRADEAIVRTLNPVGAFIFERLDGRMSQDDLIQAVTQHFAVSAETATADLNRFLEDLEQRGLLVSASS